MPAQPLTKKQKEALRMTKKCGNGFLISGVYSAHTIKSLIGRGLIRVEDGFATLTPAGESRVR